MAIAFTTQGAVPSSGTSTNFSNLSVGSSSVGNALNNSQNLGQGVSFGSGGQAQISPSQQLQNSTQALVDKYSAGSSTPSTPVKSQTVTHPDGTSVATTYHPPSSDSSSNSSSTTSGLLGSYNGAPIYSGTDQSVSQQMGLLPPAPTAPIANATISTGGTSSPQAPVPPASQTPTPSSVASSLTNQGGSTNNTLATTAETGLINNANNNPLTDSTSAGVQGYNTALENLNTLKQQYAQFQAGLGAEGTPFAVRQGEQAAVQQQYLDELDAAQNAVTQAQQGLQYGLTEQSQQQTGLNDASSQALQGQSTAQGALSAAGQVVAPTLGQPGQTYYSPTTGTAEGGTNGAPAGIDPSVWQQYIQDYSTGNFGAIPSSITGNAQLYGQLQTAVQQNNPNFNYNAALGAGQATTQNAQTGGTAPVTTAATGYAGAVQNYTNANTAYEQAGGQASNLQTAMSGINGLNSQYANNAINSLQSQFGSAKYSSFITSLNETKQAYTNLLASVGASTPTVNGQQATDIFNSASTPSQINAAIVALNQAAYAKLQPLYEQIGTYQSNLGGGGSTATTAGTNYSF